MKGDHLNVDFRKNAQDRKVQALIEKGFTSDVIQQHVPLTVGQIEYRRNILRQEFGISVKDYRSGKSSQALQALNRIDAMLGTIKQIRTQIEKGKRQEGVLR